MIFEFWVVNVKIELNYRTLSWYPESWGIDWCGEKNIFIFGVRSILWEEIGLAPSLEML